MKLYRRQEENLLNQVLPIGPSSAVVTRIVDYRTELPASRQHVRHFRRPSAGSGVSAPTANHRRVVWRSEVVADLGPRLRSRAAHAQNAAAAYAATRGSCAIGDRHSLTTVLRLRIVSRAARSGCASSRQQGHNATPPHKRSCDTTSYGPAASQREHSGSRSFFSASAKASLMAVTALSARCAGSGIARPQSRRAVKMPSADKARAPPIPSCCCARLRVVCSSRERGRGDQFKACVPHEWTSRQQQRGAA